MEYQSYRDRVLGKNKASLTEYVKDQIDKNLNNFLSDSQYGFNIEINGEIKRIAIMGQSGLSEVKDGIYVLSKINDLFMGSLFNWNNDYWIVLKKTVRVTQDSFYGEAYRCNIQLKWVDEDGILHTEYSYAKGKGMGSAVTETLVNQAALVKRDSDNQLVAVLKRRNDIRKDKRFIINGYPYRVVSIDNITIDGITSLSLIDDIVIEGDDLINNIAAYDKYYIVLDFQQDVYVDINEPFEIKYKIMKNGVVVDIKDISIVVDPLKATVNGNFITPIVEGDIPVTIKTIDNDTVNSSFILHVTNIPEYNENIYIVGKNKISWNTIESYELSNGEVADYSVTFPSKVKGSYQLVDNKILITIADKYAGNIMLTALSNGEVYSKKIEITSEEVI